MFWGTESGLPGTSDQVIKPDSLKSALNEAIYALNNTYEPKYNRCGIVRFALFLGVSTVVEKQDGALVCLNESNISCSDWNQYFNSIYLFCEDDYKIILKDLDYVCLSYAILTASALNNK